MCFDETQNLLKFGEDTIVQSSDYISSQKKNLKKQQNQGAIDNLWPHLSYQHIIMCLFTSKSFFLS